MFLILCTWKFCVALMSFNGVIPKSNQCSSMGHKPSVILNPTGLRMGLEGLISHSGFCIGRCNFHPWTGSKCLNWSWVWTWVSRLAQSNRKSYPPKICPGKHLFCMPIPTAMALSHPLITAQDLQCSLKFGGNVQCLSNGLRKLPSLIILQ